MAQVQESEFAGAALMLERVGQCKINAKW